MKTYLLPVFLFLFSGFMLSAQTNVTLNIHHKLGDDDFAMQTAVTNNINSYFNFSRLEYYIAEISLIHDGGQETLMNDLYMLVDATEETSQELGDMDVTNVEAIRFHIGVDEGRNHSDPASYGNGHPLAPQFPSMHWGWAAGYRFGALEGISGDNLNQVWQIHALEDENYFQTEVALELMAVDGQLTINLDADYVRALENIDLRNGMITHGGFGEAITLLNNFKDYVFSPSALVSNNEDYFAVNDLKVYPNPATTLESSIYIATNLEETYQLTITNVHGQTVKELNGVQSNLEINLGLETAGVYFVSLRKNGHVLRTEKLVVQ
jgi:hypothetical protein